MRARTGVAAGAAAVTGTVVTVLAALALTGGGTPATAGDPAAVRPATPTYVAWNAVEVPSVPGVTYVDANGSPVTGRLTVPAASGGATGTVYLKAVAAAGHTLAEPDELSWEWYLGPARADDLVTTTVTGCDVTFTSRFAEPVEVYVDGAAGRDRATALTLSGAGATATVRAGGATATYDARNGADPDGAWWSSAPLDTFDCVLGTGTRGTTTTVDGCTVRWAPTATDVRLTDVSYRRGDGTRSYTGVRQVEGGTVDGWTATAPAAFDFSALGVSNVTVLWSETSRSGSTDRSYHGSVVACPGPTAPPTTEPTAEPTAEPTVQPTTGTPAPAVALTFAGSTGQRYATTTWVGVSVSGVADGAGTVTLTGVGARQTATVTHGRASFRVPASLAPGRYTATFVLATNGAGNGTRQTSPFAVHKGAAVVGSSISRMPTPRATGTMLVGAAFTGNGKASVPRPAGSVGIRIYRADGRQVWYSGARALTGGTYRTALPALAKGTYRMTVAYSGGTLALGASQERSITVR
ncbi:hypothetical protein [Nocardioides zeae]|uniref:Bacterial Ig-like domain-containing protein n=1 Tax=Nocardioides zeae TaxID=1457234 RepID=A0A6P0HGD6_9ACTN|nr:hypothetical protein [Nocardioides zeae]NEN77310.1 hypothetical protein [Nocardioides zeae]